jgi:hypothetical protein
MTDDVKTEPTTTETPAPATTDANTGTNKGDDTRTVQMSQSDLDRLMADRAGQAKRNAIGDLLNTLGVADVGALQSMAESHKQAEEAKLKAEEASKSELDKINEQLTASKQANVSSAATIKQLRIENAIMRLAPGKDIPADRFKDLLKLMDTSGIEIVDNSVDDADVEKAIDKTLEGREYLKANTATNGQKPRQGSPKRQPTTVQQSIEEQPVRKKRYSI